MTQSLQAPWARALDPHPVLPHSCCRWATPFSSLANLYSSAIPLLCTPAGSKQQIPSHNHCALYGPPSPFAWAWGTIPEPQAECLPSLVPSALPHLWPFQGTFLRFAEPECSSKHRRPEGEATGRAIHIGRASLGSRVNSRTGGASQPLWKGWAHPAFPHLNRTTS